MVTQGQDREKQGDLGYLISSIHSEMGASRGQNKKSAYFI